MLHPKLHLSLLDRGGKSFWADSLPKTKSLALGAGIDGDDIAPLSVEGGEIEMVSEFTYLGSCLCDDGEITNEETFRIAKASTTFGRLEAIFMHQTFSV